MQPQTVPDPQRSGPFDPSCDTPPVLRCCFEELARVRVVSLYSQPRLVAGQIHHINKQCLAALRLELCRGWDMREIGDAADNNGCAQPCGIEVLQLHLCYNPLQFFRTHNGQLPDVGNLSALRVLGFHATA